MDNYSKLMAGLPDTYDKRPGLLPADLMKSFSLLLDGLDGKLAGVEAQMDINNLAGDQLEQFVNQRTGLTRNPATYAIGTVTVTGTGVVNTGDIFETKSGIQYRATQTGTVSGSASIEVKCVLPGMAGNVPAGQVVQIPVTLPGITAVTNSAPMTDGFDAESDTSLRERYFLVLQTPATSGNVYHYKLWAREQAGVGDAKVYPLSFGPGTVEVRIIDQNKGAASPTLVDVVQNFIDPDSEGKGLGQAPIGAKCTVLSADAKLIDISVSAIKSAGATDSDVLTSIENSVSSYLKSIAFQAAAASYAKIGEAIISAEGVEDYSGLTVNGDIVNVPIGDKETPVRRGDYACIRTRCFLILTLSAGRINLL
ncbi:baseplate J/gp47 family protein [Paenibacillus sp. TAB 01]|uniref:baseplate J/gp47 family protein n=1 Tax=Paenibacillus sp. TAB 01 TaxID=3368988 RepID=UPI003753B623